MVNFGYGPGVKGWDNKKAPILAQRLQALLAAMEKQRKFDNVRKEMRPYVETDGMYAGVRVRKITHLTNEVEDELIAEAEKIYHDVMWPDEPKTSKIPTPGMPWRQIDNMIASACIQLIQKDWQLVHRVIGNIVQFKDETDETKTFTAWGLGMFERMEQQYDKNEWGKETDYNPAFELYEDVQHYDKLVKKSRRQNQKNMKE